MRAWEAFHLASSKRALELPGKSKLRTSLAEFSKLDSRTQNDSMTSETVECTTSSRSMSSRLASRVRMSPSLESERGSQENALDCFMSLRESCASFDPLGLCSRMFPDFSVRTVAETLQRSSSFSWSNAGMGFHGVCSTADFSESPRNAVECSLSDVLESHAPLRFYLSPRAARGILRRAEKRGRKLPMRLQRALEALSSEAAETGRTPLLSPLPFESQTDTTGDQVQEETDAITSSLPLFQRITDSRPTVALTTSRLRQRSAARTTTKATQQEDGERMMSTSFRASAGVRMQIERQSTLGLFPTTSLGAVSKEAITPTNPSEPERSNTMETAPPEMKLERLSLVRRLTPTECEVLQAFPRGWTVLDIEL